MSEFFELGWSDAARDGFASACHERAAGDERPRDKVEPTSTPRPRARHHVRRARQRHVRTPDHQLPSDAELSRVSRRGVGGGHVAGADGYSLRGLFPRGEQVGGLAGAAEKTRGREGRRGDAEVFRLGRTSNTVSQIHHASKSDRAECPRGVAQERGGDARDDARRTGGEERRRRRRKSRKETRETRVSSRHRNRPVASPGSTRRTTTWTAWTCPS